MKKLIGVSSFFLLALVVIWFGILVPKQEVNQIRNEKYYDVTGDSLIEISHSMHENTPTIGIGSLFWSIKWDALCRVSVETVMTLPNLSEFEEFDERIKASWVRFQTVLRVHEETHKFHAVNAAKEIAATRCIGGNDILEKWREIDQNFDLSTGYGRLEGVVLR